MEYRRFDDTIVLRLDPGEEICAELIRVAEKEEIHLASVSGIGAVNKIRIGAFDTEKKAFCGNQFEGCFEIVSLAGPLTTKEGEPYLHLHMSVGDPSGKVIGGHMSSAVVSATAEIILRVIGGRVGRQFSDEIGLNLFDFM